MTRLATPTLVAGAWSFEDGLATYRSPARPAEADTEAFFDAFRALETRKTRGGRPHALLVDARELREVGAAARRVVYRRSREMEGLPCAIVGRHLLQRLLVEFLIIASRFKGARFFTDEARAWLDEEVTRGDGRPI